MKQKSERINEYPPIIERLSEARSYYNFNIIEEEKQYEGENTEKYIRYVYDQIYVSNPVTREKILEGMNTVGLNDISYIDMVNKDCDNLGL